MRKDKVILIPLSLLLSTLIGVSLGSHIVLADSGLLDSEGFSIQSQMRHDDRMFKSVIGDSQTSSEHGGEGGVISNSPGVLHVTYDLDKTYQIYDSGNLYSCNNMDFIGEVPSNAEIPTTMKVVQGGGNVDDADPIVITGSVHELPFNEGIVEIKIEGKLKSFNNASNRIRDLELSGAEVGSHPDHEEYKKLTDHGNVPDSHHIQIYEKTGPCVKEVHEWTDDLGLEDIDYAFFKNEQFDMLMFESNMDPIMNEEYESISYKQIPQIPNTVKNMHGAFSRASIIFVDISHWDVSNVEDMGFLFYRSSMPSDVTGPWVNSDFYISSWNTSKVKNMSYMFSRTDFNQNISSWNTENVENMSNMFNGSVAFDQNLSSWDVSSVQNRDNFNYGAHPDFVNDPNKQPNW